MDTRQRLLEAAITVLDHDGEAAIRVRDVSRAAGVSSASLYHFFGDREGMIEAAQAERYQRSLFALMEPLGQDIARARSEKSFYDAVRHGVARMWTPDRASFRRSRIEALAAMTARPGLAMLIRDAQHTLNLTIAEMLKEPQRRGWVRPDLDVEMIGAWAQGVTNGRLLIEIDPERTDGDGWNRIAAEALVFALRGPSDRQRRGSSPPTSARTGRHPSPSFESR